MSAPSAADRLETQGGVEADPDPRRSLNLDIIVEDERWNAVPSIVDDIRRAAEALAAHLYIGSAEAAFALSSDARVHELNRDYRGKDKATNVLSFPAFSESASAAGPHTAGQMTFLGDVILAFETVAREAETESKPMHHHVMHLVVHGLLHLLGHDHETEAEAREMEGLEVQILAQLGIPDPYVEID